MRLDKISLNNLAEAKYACVNEISNHHDNIKE